MEIQLESIDSRSELLERLRTARHVLLGDDDESAREFFIVHMPASLIGLCLQGHGILPSWFIDELNDIVWIGYNSKVANVNLSSCRMNFTIELDWVFFEILCQMDDGSIIVVHELGVVRINTSGEIVWAWVAGDVVTEFSDEGESVRLETEAGETAVIDKRVGVAL